MFEGADRRGKYLLLPLDTGDTVMIHLRMSGQVLIAAGGAVRPAHTHVALTLDDGRELWFVDPRTFGEVVVFDPDNVAIEVPELAMMGVDPIAEPFTRQDLRRITRSTSRALKALLLDQHAIAGIGNIYADEILHKARLRPDRPASSLDAQDDGPPARFDRGRAHRCHRRRWVDARRRPVRRPDGFGRLVPGRPSRLRARRRTLHDLWTGLDPAHDDRRSRHPFLPRVSALTRAAAWGVAAFRGSGRSRE